MKKIIIAASLALALPLSVAIAHEPTDPPSKDKASHADMDKAKQDPHAMQGSGPPTFDMLKGHEKGHVSLADAEANSWLATNFMTCDKDKDSKVTEAEYNGCQPIK